MAARSTDGRRYPWGDEAAKWSQTRAFRQIDPVMSFPEDKSPYGIFDMAGNVQEWTQRRVRSQVLSPARQDRLPKTRPARPFAAAIRSTSCAEPPRTGP